MLRKSLIAMMMAVLLGMLFACSSSIRPSSNPARLNDFSFLQPGVTTADEVKARWGEPFSVYEDGQVQTFHMDIKDGKYQTTLERHAMYRLVLVFRHDHVLDRWSLVESGL